MHPNVDSGYGVVGFLPYGEFGKMRIYSRKKMKIMSGRFLRIVISLVCLCAASMAQEPEPGDRGLLPLEPQQLLAALPKAQEGWTLKMSTASNGVDDWLTSKAERLFEHPPEEEGGKPSLARISIVDTAKKGVVMERFADFKPDETNNGVETMLVDGMPAYLSAFGVMVQLEVLVDGRFLVEVLLKNQEKDALKEWLKLCGIGKLRGAAAGSRVVPFPGELTVVEINELKPEANYSYRLSMSTGDEIDRQLIQEGEMMMMIDEALAKGEKLEDLDLSRFGFGDE